MRRIARRTLTALALMAAASPAMADPLYTATDLGRVYAYGLNDAGQVVGGGLQAADGAPAGPYPGGFLYDSYGPNAGTMYAFTNYLPDAINASGQMFGSTTIDRAGWFSYGTASGQVTPLYSGPAAPLYNGTITASGQVFVDPQDPTTYQIHTSVYNPDGSHIDIGTPPGQSQFMGSAINDRGQVAGFSGSFADAQLYLYSGGAFQSLGLPAGETSIIPKAINDAGQIVAQSNTSNLAVNHSYLYSDGTIQTLPGLGGSVTNVMGITNTGVIYGNATTADGSDHEFLYSNGQMLDLTKMLHSLGGSISQYSYYSIGGINANGQILVYASNSGSYPHSFLLTPDGLPLPASPTSVVPVTTTTGSSTTPPEPPPSDPGPSTPTPEPTTLAVFVLAAIGYGVRRVTSPSARS